MDITAIENALNNIKNENKVIRTDTDLTFDLFLHCFTKCAQKYTANYIITAEIDKILHSFFNYLKKGEQTKGIYIAGGTGTGKTTLMNIFFDVVSLLNIKYTFGDKYIYLRPDRYKEIDINKIFLKKGSFPGIERATIYIDDFGQNKSINYMGNIINPMEEILLTRFDDMRHSFTYFSSNYPIHHEAIREKYGERIFDRLQYFCYYCELKEKNFRKT